MQRAKLRLDVHTAEMGMEMADALTVPKEIRIEEPEAAAEGEMSPEEANADQTMGGEKIRGEELGVEIEADDNDMGDDVGGPVGRTSADAREIYIGTPDRPRVDKRRGGSAEDDDSKTRRFDSPTPTEVPEAKARKVDDEMMDSMNEIDRRIMDRPSTSPTVGISTSRSTVRNAGAGSRRRALIF